MKTFNIIIIVLNTLLFFALGCLLIATGMSESTAHLLVAFYQWLEGLVAHNLTARILLCSAGLICLLVAVSTVVGNIRNRRYERTVVFHNPLGEVLIALGALEDMGKVIRSEVDALKDIKLRVVARRKGIRVTAKVVLWSDSPLPRATEQTQEAIRRYMQNILGVEQDIRPRVLVSKVAFRDPEAEARPADAPYPRARRKF